VTIAIERSVMAACVGAEDEGLTIMWQAVARNGKGCQAVVVVAPVAGCDVIVLWRFVVIPRSP
jgi:hypothetical protein